MSVSKREEVLAYLRQHDGATINDVVKGCGVAWGTARKYLAEAQAQPSAALVQVEQAQERHDERPPEEAEEPGSPTAERVEEAVSVSADYLATLEALRDQVIETQRLRRLLEGRR